MSGRRNLRVAFILSIIAGILIVLNSPGSDWTYHAFSISIMFTCGILILVGAVFLYRDSEHRVFWSAMVLFSSALSFLAVGLAGGLEQLFFGALAMILGVIGGALGIAC
ncbi:MAG: hypothetical protein ACE5GD_03000 [Candidatus Geothermarchaeales archaeon]